MSGLNAQVGNNQPGIMVNPNIPEVMIGPGFSEKQARDLVKYKMAEINATYNRNFTIGETKEGDTQYGVWVIYLEEKIKGLVIAQANEC